MSKDSNREWEKEFENEFAGWWDYKSALTERIKDFIHQELQKARQDWLREEIVKLEEMKRITLSKGEEMSADEEINQALQTIIDRYLQELKDITKE